MDDKAEQQVKEAVEAMRAAVKKHGADVFDDMDCRPDFDRDTGIRIPERLQDKHQQSK